MSVRLSWDSAHPENCRARIHALSGAIRVGVVYPCDHGRVEWTCFPSATSGKANTVLAAKSALLAEFSDWCRRAALTGEAAA